MQCQTCSPFKIGKNKFYLNYFQKLKKYIYIYLFIENNNTDETEKSEHSEKGNNCMEI